MHRQTREASKRHVLTLLKGLIRRYWFFVYCTSRNYAIHVLSAILLNILSLNFAFSYANQTHLSFYFFIYTFFYFSKNYVFNEIKTFETRENDQTNYTFVHIELS